MLAVASRSTLLLSLALTESWAWLPREVLPLTRRFMVALSNASATMPPLLSIELAPWKLILATVVPRMPNS